MEKTSVNTSSEVKKYDYEGKALNQVNIQDNGSNIGFYISILIFLSIFFVVIIAQVLGF